MVQEIVGHTGSSKFLNALLERGVQSFLLVGPEGVGKKTIACWYAKKILCEKKLGDACTCKSCTLFEKRISPDFKFLQVDGKYFKIEQIASLQEACSTRPKISDRKVFLIPCAHKMTSAAANSLLKTLEEPSDYVTIFLISENLNQILRTIRSRCSVVSFKALKEDDVKTILQQQGYEKNLDVASQLSFGSVKRALAFLTGSALRTRDQAFNFLETLGDLKLYQIFEIVKDIEDAFIDYLHLLLFDLFATHTANPIKNQDRLEDLGRIHTNFSQEFLIKSLEKTSILKQKMRYNIDRELHFSQFLLELKALFSKYTPKCSKNS